MRINKVFVADVMDGLNPVELKNAPQKIEYLGNLDLLRYGARAAVVGSRHPTLLACRRAAKLARTLVANRVVVVSGLAEGIDAAAHNAAIEAGGQTIAVLGTPLDRPYPSSNIELFKKISKNHLAISQFPVGSSVQRGNFPARNRTMALLAHATIVVEAADRSGTLHQAWEAIRLGRPLFILESILKRSDLTWPAELRKFGAQILSEETFPCVLEQIPAERYSKEFVDEAKTGSRTRSGRNCS